MIIYFLKTFIYKCVWGYVERYLYYDRFNIINLTFK